MGPGTPMCSRFAFVLVLQGWFTPVLSIHCCPSVSSPLWGGLLASPTALDTLHGLVRQVRRVRSQPLLSGVLGTQQALNKSTGVATLMRHPEMH